MEEYEIDYKLKLEENLNLRDEIERVKHAISLHSDQALESIMKTLQSSPMSASQ